MRFGSVVFLSIFMLVSSSKHTYFPLPKSAKIAIGQTQWKKDGPDAELCKNYTVTAKQIRTQFRTYHLLGEGDVHDSYSVFQCWVDGTVSVDGKTFTWQSRPRNLLETTWPDGAHKVLGGRPSGKLED